MERIEVQNKLNTYGQKKLDALVVQLTGETLGFNPFVKGYPTGGKKKVDCINWIMSTHYALFENYFFMLKPESSPRYEKREIKPEIKQTKKPIDLSNIGRAIEEILEVNSGSVDREEVVAIIQEVIQPEIKKAIQDIQPQMIVIDKVKKVEYKTDGAVNKPIFEFCLKLANQPENSNVMLVGPAGSGKTHIVSQIAKAMGRSFTTLSVTAGISESHLTGWMLPIGENGKFLHLDAPFVKAYEEGNAIILLDEMDACDPNVLLTINQALANGGFTVAQRHEKSYVKRGENVAIFGACNTFGSGADHRYVGREQLDLSTLDRFDMVEMDYDNAMEKALCGANHVVIEWANAMRKIISRNKLDRLFSTRKLLNYHSKIESGAFTLAECKKLYFAGWSKDDLALVA